MVKDICCTLCLADNKRIINIYNTALQYVYENLANLKVRYGVCWMCYICYAKLQQCHKLQQLAIKTRGLVDVICENKMEIQFRAYQPLLALTRSEIKITSVPNLPLSIKEEPNLWTQRLSSNATTIDHKFNEKPSNKSSTDSEDDVPISDLHSSKLDGNKKQDNANNLEFVKVKLNPSVNDKYGHPNITNVTIKKEYFEDAEEPTSASGVNTQSIEIVEIKIERKEEMEDEGTEVGVIHESIKSYESRLYEKEPERDCNEKSYSCETCSKKFSRRSYLVSHSRCHTGYKPFGCNYCSKNFARKSCLQKHIITHTGEQPFSCKLCPKKFSQTGSLKSHMRTHTGEKPFSCPMCPKKFSQKGHLQHHVRGHTGEKPYGCDLCSKRFSQKASLDYHVRIHTSTSYE